MDCHGTCPSCQAEKAAMEGARRVEDQAGNVRFTRPRGPTTTATADAARVAARRAKAKAARHARKLQRRRSR
jgi:hypothetical protein